LPIDAAAGSLGQLGPGAVAGYQSNFVWHGVRQLEKRSD